MRAIVRSVTTILGGTASAQMLTLLAMPLVSRLYGPADYGFYGVVVAATMVVAIVASFQLHQAIVLPKLEVHAVGLLQLASLGVLAGGLLTAVAVFGYWCAFDDDMTGQHALVMSLLCGLAVSVVGVGQASQGMAVRRKAFGCIAIAAMVRAVVAIALQIILGLSSSGAIGLLAGYVGGEVAALLYLCKFALPPGAFNRRGGWKRYWGLARLYKDFVSFGTAQEAMNSASQGVPVMLLAIYFGQTVAGYYAFAIRIIMAPVNMIAGAVRQVLSARFAESLAGPERIGRDFRRATLGLAIPSVAGALLVMPFTPDLFAILFGHEWREAGEYGVWLILWCAFLIINVPATLIFRILRRQNVAFMINIVVLASRVSVLVIGGMYATPITTVLVFALIGVAWNVVIIGTSSGYVRMKNEVS